jgi:hypothetical protein
VATESTSRPPFGFMLDDCQHYGPSVALSFLWSSLGWASHSAAKVPQSRQGQFSPTSFQTDCDCRMKSDVF